MIVLIDGEKAFDKIWLIWFMINYEIYENSES